MKLFALREEFGRAVHKGDVLFSPGQEPDEFFVVMRGRIQLEQPGFEPQIVPPGDLFGHVELFAEKPRRTTATALEDSNLLAFTRDTAIRLAEATPSFALVVIRKSCERMTQVEDQLLAGGPSSNGKHMEPATAPGRAAMAAEPAPAAPATNEALVAAASGDQVGPVTAVDYENALWKKDVKCPNCRFNFHAWNIRSASINVTGRDTDFMTHYQGVDPNWYMIWVCPNCQLAAKADDFPQITSVQVARTKPKLEEVKKADAKRYDFGYYRDEALALRSYQLALPFYDGNRGGSEVCAGLYHRMAWVERVRGNEEEEKVWLRKAREYYEKAFTGSDAGKQGVLWAYLIAELDMRIGEAQDAVKWFGTAAQQPDFKSQPLLEKMVRDRWAEAGDLAKAPR